MSKVYFSFSIKVNIILCFVLVFAGVVSSAQTLPVGLLENIEDSYRRSQLLGLDTSNSSYMIRPIHLSSANGNVSFDNDQDLSFQSLFKPLYLSRNEKTSLYALPVVWQQQFNSHHPYGMNDGSMVQAKGYQTQFSAGVYFKSGPLSIQLRPEFVFAQNSDFETIEENSNDAYFHNAYAKIVYNRIDNPAKFGDGSYQKASWGQSSIRLTFDPVSFGLSTENLWWGPGIKNSLLMSNNATGFKHLTLNTTRPINTYIGAFEAQIIAGRLDQSGVAVPEGGLFVAKPNDWRYLSGIIFTYQPKWVPNLYLGFDRTFMTYKKDLGNSFLDYFPFLSSFGKLNNYDKVNLIAYEDTKKRDQYLSFFARWVMPESKAEVYFEYGRNDHSAQLRDFIVEPEQSRAYIVGFRKLVALRYDDEYIETGIEFTQLEFPKTGTIRATPSWYAHLQVLAGYTNNGQVIGAGIGPGSNMQSLNVSWVKGLKRIGLSFDRLVNNNDFFYKAGRPFTDLRRHWIDLAVGGNFSWNYKNFILNSQLTYIRSLNYQWKLEEGDFYWEWPKKDVNNFHLKAGILYRW